uniref:Uncharacterized protein n=1 Tax=Lutzomyia longipalpis TaxID=7200 RepID=A0A1B0C7Z2_LUTLO
MEGFEVISIKVKVTGKARILSIVCSVISRSRSQEKRGFSQLFALASSSCTWRDLR